jgi:outer membrane protein
MRFLLLFFLPVLVYATPKRPLWEFGLATGYANVPHYPTASQSKERFLLFPIFFYRGKVLRSDQNDGLRARLTQNKKLQLDLSYGGSFPASSKGNKARSGMEDLDWTFEIGPRFSYVFHNDKDYRLRLLTAIRPAVTTNFSHTQLRGYRSVVSLNYQKRGFLKTTWRASLWTSLTFITEGLSDYFFEVKSRDIANERPSYNAKGGYFSANLSGALIMNYEKKNLVLGLSYANYTNSVVQDSPLYKDKSNTVVFVGLSWFFYESKEKGYK